MPDAIPALIPQQLGKDILAEPPAYDLIELLFFAYRDFVGDADQELEAFGFGRAHHRVLHFVHRYPGLKVADLIVGQFGKRRLVAGLRPDDFAALKNHMTMSWGLLRVGDFIQHVRSVFKHAYDAELIDRPVRFGPGFDRRSAKTVRLHRAKQGPKLFTQEEVRKRLGAAGPPLKAMVLRGINCGLGNADCAALPLSAKSQRKLRPRHAS